MKKTSYLFCLVLVLPLWVHANLKFNPSQMQQFMETNQCPNCDLSNGSLDWGGNKIHANAVLTNANLSEMANDVGMSLPNSDFSGAIMSGISLSSADLSHARLINAILVNADLSYSDLSNSDCQGAVFINADLSNSNLQNSNISSAQLATVKSVCNAILPDGQIGKCF